MTDYARKLSIGRWFIRILMGASMIGLLLMYGSSKNVTIAELAKVIANTSVVVVIAVELLDKIADKSVYVKLYGRFYRATGVSPGTKSSMLVSIITPAVVSIGVFALTLYLVAGTLAFSLGAYSPAVILWAGAIATYIMLPETGDDELIAWAWLGATIATHGQYLSNALALPAIMKIAGILFSRF